MAFLFLRSKLTSIYTRITLNRVTTAFFVISFLHCFAQGIIQSLLFSIDAEYNSLLSSITRVAAIPPKNITYLEGMPGSFHLRMCNDIPYGQAIHSCFDLYLSVPNAKPTFLEASHQAVHIEDGLVISAVHTPTTAPTNSTGVTLTSQSTTVTLSHQCTQMLVYPQQITLIAKQEDLTFVLMQFWLLAISVIAIMYESVPHTLTVLITRFTVTAWSTYAVWRTRYIKAQFSEMIFQDGTPCSMDLFPDYFRLRVSYEILDLVLNATTILLLAYLSWHLFQDYNGQSLKCVGAPKHINQINKFFMAVQACLQLEVFVLVTAMGLWIDVLLNTAIAEISLHTPEFKALYFVTIILLLPWIIMGWLAIKQERKTLMVVFLVIAFILLAGWSIMFYSMVYRWTFMQWPFLGCFTVASLTLIIASFILGIICWLNFGKGLAQYLHAEAALASSNFSPEVFQHDEEKGEMKLDIKM